MMVRESYLEGTARAMREGKLFLMVPVMTSMEGRWVARMRWMPMARAFWARRMTSSSISRAEAIIRSANSSMMITMYGIGSLSSSCSRSSSSDWMSISSFLLYCSMLRTCRVASFL